MSEGGPSASGVLTGIRVLDLSRVMSGPYCTAMLADLGAEVIKVEIPGRGDEGRAFGPYVQNHSAYFCLLNRGKRSVTVDLKAPQGAELIRTLAAKSDVLVENFRPGVMKRLGLDYPALQRHNAQLIYASITGFGQTGPLSQLPAFDLVIQAMSGMMSVTGPRDGGPTAVGESIADVCTGMFAAWGIVAALFDRERTGKGRHVDVAMFDSMFSMSLTALSRRLYLHQSPPRLGNRHPVTYPVDSFPTRDRDIVLVAFSDAVFYRLALALDQPELKDDPRFVDNAARNRHEHELRAIIEGWTSRLTSEKALDLLRAHEIPCAPVWDFDDVVASDHTAHRGLVSKGRHAVLGDTPLVQQPVRFSDSQPPEDQRSPTLGEDTDDVLGELAGLTVEQIEKLRRGGVI